MKYPPRLLTVKPTAPAIGIDDDHPPRTINIGRRRSELTDPEHVEEDVEHATVQPRGAEDRPPSSETEDRLRAGRAEHELDDRVGRQHRQRVPGPHDVAAEGHRARKADDVEGGTAVYDQRHESQVVAKRPQHRPEAPESRIAPPAVVAGLVIHADERSARGADHRSGRLPFEHQASISSGIGGAI